MKGRPLPGLVRLSLGIGLLTLAVPSLVPAASRAEEKTPVPLARTRIEGLVESSGLVASRRHKGVFWTLNDSGGAPELFAIRLDGSLVGRVAVDGVLNVDWEDIAIDSEGRLYVGDIGNNSSRRSDLSVVVVDEPDPTTDVSVRPLRLMPFRYPDQSWPPDGAVANFDAEALFWARDHLYLLTKHRDDSETTLYRFPEGGRGGVLEKVSEFALGGMVTAADVTSDGRYLAVLSYNAVTVFERPTDSDDYLSGTPLFRTTLAPPVTKLCEGIAWAGGDLVVSNEQEELHLLPDALERRAQRYP